MNLCISKHEVVSFKEDGFVLVPGAFNGTEVSQTCAHLERILELPANLRQGKDPWVCRTDSDLRGRKGIRYILNSRKCDSFINQIVTSSALGRAVAALSSWPGTRLLTDSVWWKQPGADAVPFHQDGTLVRSFLAPSELLTCWIALDNCSLEVGALQYAKGSHLWPHVESVYQGQGAYPGNYEEPVLVAAQSLGLHRPEIVNVEGTAGFCVFHHGNLWHGSPNNKSNVSYRRALAVHFISSDSKFVSRPEHPMYAQYYNGSSAMDERFFPVIWRDDGYCSSQTSSH